MRGEKMDSLDVFYEFFFMKTSCQGVLSKSKRRYALEIFWRMKYR